MRSAEAHGDSVELSDSSDRLSDWSVGSIRSTLSTTSFPAQPGASSSSSPAPGDTEYVLFFPTVPLARSDSRDRKGRMPTRLANLFQPAAGPAASPGRRPTPSPSAAGPASGSDLALHTISITDAGDAAEQGVLQQTDFSEATLDGPEVPAPLAEHRANAALLLHQLG